MPSCLDTVVTIRDVRCPENSALPTSGFDLMDAPEISVLKLDRIADEVYGTGMALAQQKLKLAATLLENDLVGFLGANRIAPVLTAPVIVSGNFNTHQPIGSTGAAAERGFTLTRQVNRRTGKLKVLKIKTVNIYALDSQTGARLNVTADGVTTFWDIDLIGGQVNAFLIDHPVSGSVVHVTLSNVTVGVASSVLNCSCNGTLPAGFGAIEGYNNGTAVRKEGFGIVAQMTEECDYGQLLCDMAKGFTGELLWLKTRILILEEHLASTRFNNWVTYNREQTAERLSDLREEYRAKWQDFGGALPNLLRAYEGDCITCKGSRWVVNV